MFEDADLRKLLTNFRETEIYDTRDWSDDAESRKHCILRRAMIDHLIKSQPATLYEWYVGLPAHLRRQTEPRHWHEYGPRIIDLVRRIAALPVGR